MIGKAIALAALGGLATGCFLDDGFDDGNPGRPLCVPIEDSPVRLGTGVALETTYLLDTIDLPGTAAEAYQFGFNLDRDDQGRPDNALGNVVAAITQIDEGDVEGAANEAIAAGQLLHLLTVVEDADSPRAGLVVRHGLDRDGDPTDNFSGEEVFGIDRSRGSGSVLGMIQSDVLTASGSQLPISLAIPGQPQTYPLRLDVAQVRVTVTEDGLEGFIGGVIHEPVVHESFVPFFADSLQVTVDRDCPGGICEPGSFGETVLEIFDEDLDGIVTGDELAQSSLTELLLAPDIDARNMASENDTGGDLVLNCDEYNDSLSISFRFTAVPAAIE